MEVLNAVRPTVYSQKQRPKTEKQQFEQMWKNTISGEEFERKAHEHIKKLYALRDKPQADC